jgi:pilus assembly protein Flp/PilA
LIAGKNGVAFNWSSPSLGQRHLGQAKGDPMAIFMQRVRRFFKSEAGPTAVEYAVMLALIVIVCLVAITSVGTATSTTFSNVAGSLSGS